MSEQIVSDEEFPHGIRCARCDQVIENGDRYAETLDGETGGLPVYLLVCLVCEGEPVHAELPAEMEQAMEGAAILKRLEGT